MALQIDDPYRDITPERWQELLRREHVQRAAARRWLFAALISCLSKGVEWCLASKPTPKSVEGH
jgi:hypothetical protein